jgi:hypothetical protein
MPGTSSAKTRFALLPGHDEFVDIRRAITMAAYAATSRGE